MVSYKVVHFVPKLTENMFSTAGAPVERQVEEVIARHAAEGWSFVSYQTVHVMVKPGCLMGLLGGRRRSAIMTSSSSLVEPARPSLPQRILLALIRAYRRTAPSRVRRSCRFHPTCSNYGSEAIRIHGARRGVGLTWRRLRRCRPPYGGDDPVPPAAAG